MIITSPGNRVRLNIDSNFLPESIYSGLNGYPTFYDCKYIIEFCRNKKYDGVIAIGGGSTMDLAKVAIAYLSTEKMNIHKLIEYKENYVKTIPSIFLPTTHGTASEVTMWGTIWNTDEKKKYSISHPNLYPSVAILDGNLTLTLPIDISLITVLDALSHSFESIWNKNSNPKSTAYAINAICMILSNVDLLKSNPLNLKVRQKLLEGSNLAGQAFSNTATSAAHSISYPLTIHYGIPHGVASSITLLSLLEINGEFIKEPLDKICNNLELTYIELKQKINSIPKNIVPFTLKEWKIPVNQLPMLASESFTKGRMENNVVDLSIDDVLGILQKLYC